MEKFYWLNSKSRAFLSKGYLVEGESAEKRMEDIAKHAEKILGIDGFAAKFYDYLSRGFYSLSSPVWSNFGRKRGLPISCFGTYIDDSIESICGDKFGEVAVMSQCGGGTSFTVDPLRGRGSPFGNGDGKTSGAVSFLELYDNLLNAVSQGGVRRGAGAAYMSIEHPDWDEFMEIRELGCSIQDLSIGCTIPDSHMNAVKNGDPEARRKQVKLLKKLFGTGYPYRFFIDNANRNMPKWYKEQGYRIHHSNLCLVGYTTVRISECANGENAVNMRLDDFIKMFNARPRTLFYVHSNDQQGNDVWSPVSAGAQTGTTCELIEIESENGNIIQCTPEHQIWTENRGWVEAQHLEETDILKESI